MAGPLEYAQGGLVGVLTPQANATVEAELSVLLPPDVGMVAGRFTCPAPDLKARLIAYFARLDEAIAQFADAPMDAIGVACTGASYLLDEQPAAFRRPWDGPMPVVSAAAAIEAALRSLGARRIAMLSPYPQWLTDVCVAYWQKQGFAIPVLREPAPVENGYHPIYAQRSRQATAVLADVASLDVDAVLISGTGLPSLAALPRLNAAGGPPVISSNLAVAWALGEILAGRGGDPASIRACLGADALWVARLAARYPSSLT